jgi:hypothetical protein
VKLTVIKYSAGSNGTLNNYFDTANNNTYEDTIVIDQFLRSKFPSYNKETTDRTDFFQVKSGNYDIELSMRVDCESNGGDNIYDFFDELDETKLMTILELNGEEEIGFIDIKTITKYLTASNYEFNISFTVYGALGEFSTYYSTCFIDPVETDNTAFWVYWQQHFLFNLANAKVFVNPNTPDWITLLGWGHPPVTSLFLQHNIVTNNTVTDDCNKWKTFKESMIQLGLVFTLEKDRDEGNGRIVFSLNMFQRSIQRTLHTIKVLEHQEGLDLPDINGWVMSRNHEYIFGLRYTIANGILFNDTQPPYNYTGFVRPQGNQFCVKTAGFPPIRDHYVARWDGSSLNTILSDDTEILNIPHDRYSYKGWFGQNDGVIMYSRIFVKNSVYNSTLNEYFDLGSNTILEKLMMPEYKFLLRGLKKTKKLKVKFDSNFQLYDHFQLPSGMDTINTPTYWINRISDLDIEKMTVVIEGIEI